MFILLRKTERPTSISPIPVSYTHLDVYKRQMQKNELGSEVWKSLLQAVFCFMGQKHEKG